MNSEYQTPPSRPSYQVRVMTKASTVFKKSTFHKFSYLNALGSKFDLDVK